MLKNRPTLGSIVAEMLIGALSGVIVVSCASPTDGDDAATAEIQSSLKQGAAIAAFFDKGTGVLTVRGNGQDNDIEVTSNTAGAILINDGQVKIRGATPTVANTTQIQVFGNGGNDRLTVSETNGALPPAVIDAGPGNDVLVGGSRADMLLGGDGDDVVTGGPGADVAFLDAGSDTFVWNPGDGSDVIEGGSGQDSMDFRGADRSEAIDVSANGPRCRLVRDVGNVVMDTGDVEQVNVAALDGADTVNVHDLTGTGVTNVAIDLAKTDGTGDGQVDSVIVNGTNGSDVMTITDGGGIVTVNGLATIVSIQQAEGQDQLQINGLDGDDVQDASHMAATMTLTLDGGSGNDVLIGSAGNDVIRGGDGDDVLMGGPGLDSLDGGVGDNVVIQD